MSLFHYFWKIWLRINRPSIVSATDCFAEISTGSTIKGMADIAEQLALEGADINYSTLMYVVGQYERVVRDLICEGYSVRTGNVIFTPRISGEWSRETARFDPEKHRRLVDCVLSPEMRNALDLIGVDILGWKDADAFIFRVTDMQTDKTDLISRNGELIIEGKGIKALAKDGSVEGCILLKGKNKRIYDLADALSVNEPNRIVLRIPSSLEAGLYHLVIQTYYTEKEGSAERYLRYIEYDKMLAVR